MSQDEINRIVLRLDKMEASRYEQQKETEIMIKETLKEHRSNMMWMFGLIFAVAFGFGGWLAKDHLQLKDAVGAHHQALKIVVGIVSYHHPGSVLEDLDNEFNPTRGGKVK